MACRQLGRGFRGNAPRDHPQGRTRITRSYLPVINKTDLAPLVGASLDVMERNAGRIREDRPFVFTNLKAGDGVERIVDFVEMPSDVNVSDRDETLSGAAVILQRVTDIVNIPGLLRKSGAVFYETSTRSRLL